MGREKQMIKMKSFKSRIWAGKQKCDRTIVRALPFLSFLISYGLPHWSKRNSLDKSLFPCFLFLGFYGQFSIFSRFYSGPLLDISLCPKKILLLPFLIFPLLEFHFFRFPLNCWFMYSSSFKKLANLFSTMLYLYYFIITISLFTLEISNFPKIWVWLVSLHVILILEI